MERKKAEAHRAYMQDELPRAQLPVQAGATLFFRIHIKFELWYFIGALMWSDFGVSNPVQTLFQFHCSEVRLKNGFTMHVPRLGLKDNSIMRTKFCRWKWAFYGLWLSKCQLSSSGCLVILWSLELACLPEHNAQSSVLRHTKCWVSTTSMLPKLRSKHLAFSNCICSPASHDSSLGEWMNLTVFSVAQVGVAQGIFPWLITRAAL